MRHNSLGSTGRPDLAALATAFQEAKERGDPVLVRLQRVGRAAKLAAGKKKGRQSAFALSSRGVHRQVTKMQREAIWKRTHHLDANTRAQALAAESSEGSLKAALATAKRQVQLDGEASRRKERQLRAEVEGFQNTRGQEEYQKMKGAMPEVCFPESGVVPVPTWKGCGFVWPCSGSEIATKSVAYASQSKATNCSACLLSEWESLHQPILQPGTKIARERDSGITDRCRIAGMCLHRGAGVAVGRLRASVMRALKETFHSPSLRHMLTSACVVLHFQRTEACMAHALDKDSEAWWMHIGWMCLKPYRPTVHVLRHVPDASLDEEDVVLEVFVNRAGFGGLGRVAWD